MEASTAERDFSVVIGGPLFQALRRAHLSGEALQLVRRRIVTLGTIAWVPLFALSALDGKAWGNAVAVPFLRDIDAHARFLVALPLLVLAEIVVHRRTLPVVTQFITLGLVGPAVRERFEAAVPKRDAAAQLGGRRADADRARLRCRDTRVLALLRGADGSDLVRGAPPRRSPATPRRVVVLPGQRAAVSIPAAALVFPHLHLGPIPLAGLAYRSRLRPGASGPSGGLGSCPASATRSRRCSLPKER